MWTCDAAAAVAVVAALAVGCSNAPTRQDRGISAGPAPSDPVTRPTQLTAPPPPPLDGAGPDEGHASPSPPDASSAQQARTRAGAFMRAFARTDLPQQQWWNGLAGSFTPAARAIYQSTDVVNVPVHKVVEGSARLRSGTTKFRAEVTVDTDAGIYTVTMIRAGGAWLVDRATPPKS